MGNKVPQCCGCGWRQTTRNLNEVHSAVTHETYSTLGEFLHAIRNDRKRGDR